MSSTALVNGLIWHSIGKRCGDFSISGFESHEELYYNKDGIIDNNCLPESKSSQNRSFSLEYGRVLDLQNQLILPGLHDSHIHVGLIGESKYYESCSFVLIECYVNGSD